MAPVPRLALAAALLGPLTGLAQDVAVRGGEPRVERTVSEDDQVRIEELRVRGQVRRIVVLSKIGAGRYEVLPAQDGRDLSQDKRAIGQRVWSVLTF